jgi:hypothetical protein
VFAFSICDTSMFVNSVIRLRTTGQLKRLRRRSPWSMVHPCQRPSALASKFSPASLTAPPPTSKCWAKPPTQNVRSLEPRICCSRGDTEGQDVAGSCCLLQLIFQPSLGCRQGCRELSAANTVVCMAVMYVEGGRAGTAAPPGGVAHKLR